MNDIQHPPAAAVDPDELDLVGFIKLLWRHKLMVSLACLLCGVTAVVLALVIKPIFRAEVVVTEVRNRDMSGGGGLATELGGLATLAGVDLASATGMGQEATAVLNSHHLVEEFVKRNNLMPMLLRHSKKATLWLATQKFKEGVMVIRKDSRKGVITVDIEWTDPVTAAYWANGFVALANELIRQRAVEEASRNIAYLDGQLARTNDVELRKIIYNLIESQTKTLMLANGRIEYAFEVVDAAVPPERKTRPHRTLMVLVGLAVGLTLGMSAAVIRDRFERSRRRARATWRRQET
jgi:uncharacterized protein involved in exopolysaccharide biosynthesis